MPHFSIPCPCWGKGSKVWQRRTETDTRSRDGVILHQNKNDCSFHSALDSLYTFSNPTLSAWTLLLTLFLGNSYNNLYPSVPCITCMMTCSSCVHKKCPLIHPFIVLILFCCNYLVLYHNPH